MNRDTVVLAVETSSRTGSVALGFGDTIAGETFFSGFMRHSTEIFSVIESLLKKYDVKPENLEHLYISNGPGSFTGLRIAASLAKMMYLANSLKIVTVDSLDVIAFNASEAIKAAGRTAKLSDDSTNNEILKIAAVLDAKRGQFFVAVYKVIRDGEEVLFEKTVPDSLMTPGEFCEKFAFRRDTVWLLGDGLVYHRQEFQSEGIEFLEEKYWSPGATGVYQLGRKIAQKNLFADPVNFKPFYLCRPEIRIKQR
jgi:tRNA threonylcarbamoyladenosine biosynthesis protein TsaB